MSPVLREPAVLEVAPYAERPVRAGDVIFFVPPTADQPVVHRVVRVTLSGITTRGDNSTREDPYQLRPEDILGRVVAVLCGRDRRAVAGGLKGRGTSLWLLWSRITRERAASLLRPVYHALSRWGGAAQLVPRRLRARVVVFRSQGEDRFQLQMGRRVIGRYDNQKECWRIRRPFRLFVDVRRLCIRRGGDRGPGG